MFRRIRRLRSASDPVAVVSRFVDAANRHDADGIAACLHPDFESIQPIYPSRNFRGSVQVRRNWLAIFESEPGFRLSLVRSASSDDTVWVELHGAGRDLEVAGVFIMGVQDELVRWARVYSAVVEQPARKVVEAEDAEVEAEEEPSLKETAEELRRLVDAGRPALTADDADEDADEEDADDGADDDEDADEDDDAAEDDADEDDADEDADEDDDAAEDDADEDDADEDDADEDDADEDEDDADEDEDADEDDADEDEDADEDDADEDADNDGDPEADQVPSDDEDPDVAERSLLQDLVGGDRGERRDPPDEPASTAGLGTAGDDSDGAEPREGQQGGGSASPAPRPRRRRGGRRRR